MLRVRSVAIGLLLLFLVGMLFWPVVLTYTHVAGEKATASVKRCERADTAKTSALKCTGTWRTEGGGGSGGIYGLDEDDAGTDVQVRIGPMGPYAGGFAGSWFAYLTAVPLLLSPPVIVWMRRTSTRPGRRLAQHLLADQAGGALFIVTEGRVDHANGLPHAALGAPVPPPPGYRPVEIPGRALRVGGRSSFDDAAGINRDGSGFEPLETPGGRTLAIVEHRSAEGYEPDHVLLDPDGTTRALIRRISPHPVSYALIDSGGAPLGSATRIGGGLSNSVRVKDVQGGTIARIAHTGRRRVVRVEDTASPLHRDIALVLALTQFRMTD